MSGWGRQAPAGGWWQQPTHENTNLQAPGHERMFDRDVDGGDPVNRAFVTRKRHGWWGPEERYDAATGRKID